MTPDTSSLLQAHLLDAWTTVRPRLSRLLRSRWLFSWCSCLLSSPHGMFSQSCSMSSGWSHCLSLASSQERSPKWVCLFLGPHLWHTEVPSLGGNWSGSCQPMSQPQKHRIPVTSAAYTTDHGNIIYLTYWAKPGIKPASSLIITGFITYWATTGTHLLLNFKCF